MELISLNQAAAGGVERIRKPIWANPMDHFRLHIIDGKPGPWLHLHAPFNAECNGRDPVDILWIIQFGTAAGDDAEFIPYEGPLPDSVEYKAAQARYARVPQDKS
jgi:hypothetical protein